MSKALRGPYGLREGSKAAGPMRKREPLQPREISARKGEVAEPIMSRRRQQTAPEGAAWDRVAACGKRSVADNAGAAQDASGVEGGARGDSPIRNRRGPPRRPTSGEGGAYKPKAKGLRAGRESEGPVVPRTAGTRTPLEGRGPALTAPADGGKREGMAERPNHPIDKARELRGRLFMVAKGRTPHRLHAIGNRRSDDPGRGVGRGAGGRSERGMRTSSVSRVREIRMHGLNGGHRSPGPQGHRA
jgi:hypothetical protein